MTDAPGTIIAKAYDREDAAQMGEPDPWTQSDADDVYWRSERVACAHAAIDDLHAAGFRIVGPGEAKALESAVFKLVSDECGRQTADRLAENQWAWPDDAPSLISPIVFSAVATLRALTSGGDHG